MYKQICVKKYFFLYLLIFFIFFIYFQVLQKIFEMNFHNVIPKQTLLSWQFLCKDIVITSKKIKSYIIQLIKQTNTIKNHFVTLLP